MEVDKKCVKKYGVRDGIAGAIVVKQSLKRKKPSERKRRILKLL